jgi:hypothetical protein
MRHRVRIQPYVSPDIHRKLRAHTTAKDLTESAVTEAALGEYLEENGVDEPLILRRLDGVVQALTQLQRDVDVVAQAIAVLARYAFAAGPGTFSTEAAAQGEKMYRLFARRISDQLGAGARLAGDVRRAHAQPRPAPTNSSVPGGR